MKILCSAIYVDDGRVYEHQPKNIKSGFVVCGRRHHNCIATLSLIFKDIELLIPYKQQGKVVQGFLTDTDIFLDRKESYKVAKTAKQIIHDELISNTLTSEDLW